MLLIQLLIELTRGWHVTRQISCQDQKPGTKKCGHMGGKVLVSTQELLLSQRAQERTRWNGDGYGKPPSGTCPWTTNGFGPFKNVRSMGRGLK